MFGLKMPKEMINFTLDRKGNEPWGFVIVGGKDQVFFIVTDIDIGIDIDTLTLALVWTWVLTYELSLSESKTE